MKRVLKMLIMGLISCGIMLSMIYVLGLIVDVIKCHFWLMIPLGVYVTYKIFKEI